MASTRGGSLRVALLSPCFWPEVRRGGERFTRELADGLLAHGHAPRLITSHRGMLSRTREEGLSILRLPRPPAPRLLERMYEPYMTHVPLSYLALRRGGYDLAHAVYPTDALAVSRWRRRTGRPAVLSYLGIPDRDWLRERHRGAVLGVALRGCSAVTALSHYAADAFTRWLGYEAPVIPPGVDLDAFPVGAERTPEPTIVCSAAAEEPRKHVALLVQAFARVRAERPDARLILSRPRDPAAAHRNGIPRESPGVQWANLDDLATLARAYGSAWVSVLPARAEAFGLVLVEALACGTPVVGYDDGGIPEIIDRPEIGRTFPRLDAAAMAAALLETLELAEAPETRRRCHERASDFSARRFTQRYLELYREIGAFGESR